MAIQQSTDQTVFLEAIEYVPEERWAAFIKERCGDDIALLHRVQRLLHAHRDLGNVRYPRQLAAESVKAEEASVSIGRQIGPYKLREKIGEGGMGIVYVAEQSEPIRRKVALKVIKPGMATKDVVARFEVERQALAMMNHEHIARVFDGGTTEAGQPYFVMELVQGLPITEYCNQLKLNPRERLKLFLNVCQGMHHAHQKGIIHRDLKPSNVLVPKIDDTAVPKVIDFGVAKAVDQKISEQTVYTRFQQLVGTPLYMSPEQMELGTVDVDVRSDVYSLGVLLYELLTGDTPFDRDRLKAAGFDEMRRIIREEEPKRPSVLVSTLQDKARSTIVERQSISHRELSRSLRGDLDWIVMKALEKDRSRRYESVRGLANDIGRFLHGQPVEARKPSIGYLTTRFAKRHRGPLAAAVTALTAMTVGLVLAIGGYRSAVHEQRATAKRLYVNSILAAEKAIEGGNGDRAQQLLASCAKEFRGWEWDRLNWLSDRRRASLPYHTSMNAFDLSPDGKTFVTADDSSLVLWDTAEKSVQWEVDNATDHKAVTAVTYSPDSSRILSVDTAGVIRIWNAANGHQLCEPFRAHDQSDAFKGLAFSPDGTTFATGDAAGLIKLWDANEPNRLVWEVPAHQGTHVLIWSIEFSPNGKQIVSCCADGTLKLWDAEDGNLIASCVDSSASPNALKNIAHDGYVNDAEFGPDGRRLVSCGNDKQLKVWDVRTGSLIRTLHAHRGSVLGAAFSRAGDRIASVGNDRTLRLWHATSHREIETLLGPTTSLDGVVFTPDGRSVVTRSRTGIDFWPVTPAQAHRVLTGHEAWLVRFPNQMSVLSLDVSRNGRRIVSAHKAGLIKLWDAHTGEELQNWIAPNVCLVSIAVAISPDGSLVVAGGSDGTISAWNANEEEPLYEIGAHDSRPINSIAISPDGSWMASASADKTVKIWNTHTGKLKNLLSGHTGDVLSVVISSDARQIISGSNDATVRIWDATNARVIKKLLGHRDAVHAVAINRGGDKIVSGGADRQIILWNAATGDALQTMVGHTGPVQDIAFSQDQTRIVSGGGDGSVMLWACDSSEPLWTIEPDGSGRTSSVASVRFFPNDTALAAGYSDGLIKIWDRQPKSYDPTRWYDNAAARDIVDQLSQQCEFHDEVLAAIRNSSSTEDVDDKVANTAICIARARRMSFAMSHCMDVRTLWFRERNPQGYRKALNLAERASLLAPESPMTTWTLGAAQYYAGLYERAAQTLRRTDEMWQRVLAHGHPLAVTYLGMSLQQLGQVDAARTKYDRLRRILSDDPTWRSTPFRTTGIDEFEALIDARRQ